MKHLKQYLDYEFHVAEEKSTDELIDELVEAFEESPKPKKRRTFTDEELEKFCQTVVLHLLRRAIDEHGLTSIKELIEEIQEPDNAGDEWKDQL